MSSISKNLRTILDELNMTQTDFAESLNISFGYFNMLINGRKKSISQSLALLIEKMYGYSAVWLLENRVEKKAEPIKINNKQLTQIKELVNQLSPTEIQLVFQHIAYLEAEDKEK
jgi:transcriptional regulator with XRE-family HTH domain